LHLRSEAFEQRALLGFSVLFIHRRRRFDARDTSHVARDAEKTLSPAIAAGSEYTSASATTGTSAKIDSGPQCRHGTVVVRGQVSRVRPSLFRCL
jgi:hypothetical protein